jgi:hypothetical protein
MASQEREVSVEELLEQWGEAGRADGRPVADRFWRSEAAFDAFLHVQGFERGSATWSKVEALPDGARMYSRTGEPSGDELPPAERADARQANPPGERIAIEFDDRGEVHWKFVEIEELSAPEVPAFHQLRDDVRDFDGLLAAEGLRSAEQLALARGRWDAWQQKPEAHVFADFLRPSVRAGDGWLDAGPMKGEVFARLETPPSIRSELELGAKDPEGIYRQSHLIAETFLRQQGFTRDDESSDLVFRRPDYQQRLSRGDRTNLIGMQPSPADEVVSYRIDAKGDILWKPLVPADHARLFDPFGGAHDEKGFEALLQREGIESASERLVTVDRWRSWAAAVPAVDALPVPQPPPGIGHNFDVAALLRAEGLLAAETLPDGTTLFEPGGSGSRVAFLRVGRAILCKEIEVAYDAAEGPTILSPRTFEALAGEPESLEGWLSRRAGIPLARVEEHLVLWATWSARERELASTSLSTPPPAAMKELTREGQGDPRVAEEFASRLRTAGFEYGGWLDGRPVAVRYGQARDDGGGRDYDEAERIVWEVQGTGKVAWKEVSAAEFDRGRFGGGLRYQELASPERDVAAFESREGLQLSELVNEQLIDWRENMLVADPELLQSFLDSLGITRDGTDPANSMADGTLVFETPPGVHEVVVSEDYSGSYVAIARSPEGLVFKDASFAFPHQTFDAVSGAARPIRELLVGYQSRVESFFSSPAFERFQEERYLGRPSDEGPDVRASVERSSMELRAQEVTYRSVPIGPVLSLPLEAALAEPKNLDRFLAVQGYAKVAELDDGSRVYEPPAGTSKASAAAAGRSSEHLVVRNSKGRLAFKTMKAAALRDHLTVRETATFESLKGRPRGLRQFLGGLGLRDERSRIEEVDGFLAWARSPQNLPPLRSIAVRLEHFGLRPDGEMGQLAAFTRSVLRQGYEVKGQLADGSRVLARPGRSPADAPFEVVVYRLSPKSGAVEWKSPHYERDGGAALVLGESSRTFDDITVAKLGLGQMWSREEADARQPKGRAKEVNRAARAREVAPLIPARVAMSAVGPAPTAPLAVAEPTKVTAVVPAVKPARTAGREEIVGVVLWKPDLERTQSGDLYTRVFVRDEGGKEAAAVFWGARATELSESLRAGVRVSLVGQRMPSAAAAPGQTSNWQDLQRADLHVMPEPQTQQAPSRGLEAALEQMAAAS